ncbi:PspC domain-containing protein [Nesterenkonia halotolerans]
MLLSVSQNGRVRESGPGVSQSSRDSAGLRRGAVPTDDCGTRVTGWDARTMEGMEILFKSIRSIGFRRGPGRVLAGIGGSIAAKFGFNVWLVRLVILLSFLLPVLGVGAYLLVWVLTPWQDGRIPLERALEGRR